MLSKWTNIMGKLSKGPKMVEKWIKHSKIMNMKMSKSFAKWSKWTNMVGKLSDSQQLWVSYQIPNNCGEVIRFQTIVGKLSDSQQLWVSYQIPNNCG